MEQILLSQKNTINFSRSIVTDIVLLGIIYLLPTISHLLAFPLYLLDPMRIVIFASILISNNKYNSYLLAVTIPLFSFFVGGHPIFLKSVIISIELLANVILFGLLLKRWKNVFLVTLTSIFVAKVMYYAIKYIFVDFGWMQMELVSTAIIIQVVVTLTISILMYFIMTSCQYDKLQ